MTALLEPPAYWSPVCLEPEWCERCARTDDPRDQGLAVDIVEWIHDGVDEDPREGSRYDTWTAVLSCGHDITVQHRWPRHQQRGRWLT